jgi:hypothetical protein
MTPLSTAQYSLSDLSDRFAHLTNYSINKNAENFKFAEYGYSEGVGGGGDGDASSWSSSCSSTGSDMDMGVGVGMGVGKNPIKTPEIDPTGGKKDTTDPEIEGFKWTLTAFQRWLSNKEGTLGMCVCVCVYVCMCGCLTKREH